MSTRIHAVQFDIAWEAPAANVSRIESLVRAAGVRPGDLVAVPEMATTGFTMKVAAAVTSYDPSVAAIQALAAELGITFLLGIAAPAANGRGANQSIVIGPQGNVIARYTKIHPYAPGGEAAAFVAGNELVTFEWNGFTVAPLICYDLRFPELFRAAVRRGVTLFIVIASWPVARVEHWVTLLRARAIENQAYVLGVNRCGRDPNLLYPGRSMLIDPMGVIRADAADGESVLSDIVDPAVVKDVRSRLPFLNDMRDDSARW